MCNRKARRPRLGRRLWCGLRRRRHLRGPVECARPRQIRFAAIEGRLPPFLAGDSGEPLDEARRHCRRAGKLGGVAENDLFRTGKLGKIVRGQTDAPLRQIKPEIISEFQLL